MKRHNASHVLAGMILLLLLPSCWHSPFDPHKPISPSLVQEESSIRVSAHLLEKSKTNRLAAKQVARRYFPIDLSIKNMSTITYVLNKNSVPLSLGSIDQVARRLQANPWLNLFFPLAYATPKKFFTQLLITGAFFPFMSHYSLAASASAFIGLPAYPAGNVAWSHHLKGSILHSIASTGGNYYHTRRDDKKVKWLFRDNALDLTSEIEIAPGQTLNKMIYVKHEDLKVPELSLKLFSKEGVAEVSFTLTISDQETLDRIASRKKRIVVYRKPTVLRRAKRRYRKHAS